MVGDTMPELTDDDVTYEGFVNDEDKTDLSGRLIMTLSDNSTNQVVTNGTITPSGLVANNYDINFLDGRFTVNEKLFSATPYIVSGVNNGGAGEKLCYTGDITFTPDPAVCGNFQYISISIDGGKTWSAWGTSAVVSSVNGDTENGQVIIKMATKETGEDSAIVELEGEYSYKLGTNAEPTEEGTTGETITTTTNATIPTGVNEATTRTAQVAATQATSTGDSNKPVAVSIILCFCMFGIIKGLKTKKDNRLNPL